MSAYQQMGHHSANLLADPQLNRYQGAILSPVNYSEAEVATQIIEGPVGFDMVFDPQLYFPNTERGRLRDWSYFPSDVDTADLSSDAWWAGVVEALVDTCTVIGPDAVCSPAVVPRVYSTEYYAQLVRVGDLLEASLRGTNIRPVQTALISIRQLAASNHVFEVASILSRTSAEAVYLILVGDTHPRRELNESEDLKGAMRLIAALEAADLPVIVGFSSSEMILWKAAGATSCATGKFFNLRRFTSSRFDEPAQGGGQLPYWFEEALFAFLRESDILRVQRRNMLSPASLRNPFGADILEQLSSSPGTAWLGLSWRQYMYSFADLEHMISTGEADIPELLLQAEDSWLSLEDAGVLMEEPRNNGRWIRPWRRALLEFPRP